MTHTPSNPEYVRLMFEAEALEIRLEKGLALIEREPDMFKRQGMIDFWADKLLPQYTRTVDAARARLKLALIPSDAGVDATTK